MTRQELIQQIRQKNSFLCVGLDTDINKIPQHLLADDNPIFEFNKAIIDATAPFCVSYKPNLAFYEAEGTKGIDAFQKTVEYLKQSYPHHFIIADAKRGDIGNTAALYARTFFQHYDVDSLTVAPYMGEDSVTPFLSHPGKWVILLALTSNKGAYDFQLTPCQATREDLRDYTSDRPERLFEKVIRISQKWGTEDNMMFVVGATQGRMFADIRQIAPRHFLLVPGVGAQGGSLDEVCRFGMISDCGLLVNSSRAIIYASSGTDFAQAAAEKAKELQSQMAEQLRMRC